MLERERRGAVCSNIDIEQAIREGRIVIEPFDPELVNPASIDIRLFHEFKVFDSHRHTAIDPRNIPPDLMRVVEADEGNPFVLHPNEFALGSTLEVVMVPPELTATLEGKSSLGRLGLIIHSTAGYKVKLDNSLSKLLNSGQPISITPGTPIATQSATLIMGDVNNDNMINISDFTQLRPCFFKNTSSPQWNTCQTSDFNDDGRISVTDYSRLITNFGRRGE